MSIETVAAHERLVESCKTARRAVLFESVAKAARPFKSQPVDLTIAVLTELKRAASVPLALTVAELDDAISIVRRNAA